MDSYTIYKHTSPSGKVYIGITKQRPEARWANGSGYKHSPHFRAAIEKYGWENIQHEILMTGVTKETAETTEIAMIAKYRATDRRYGYNADHGGQAPGSKSRETRQKISAAVRGEKHPLYGKKQDPEWVERRMTKIRGYKVPPEHREKLVRARSVPVVCVDTGRTYPSAAAAGRVLGIPNSKITAVCRGRRKTAGGRKWKYAEED